MNKENDNRSHIRFNPDSFDIAIIGTSEDDFKGYDESTYNFTGTRVALISDESYSGCSLIVIYKGVLEHYLNPGETYILKVGKLNPMKAEVKWKKVLNDHVIQAGFEYVT